MGPHSYLEEGNWDLFLSYISGQAGVSKPEGEPLGYDSSRKTAYGKRFRLSFGHGKGVSGQLFESSSTRVLASVTETNYQTEVASPQGWSCPERLRFMIVHPEDNRNAELHLNEDASGGVSPLLRARVWCGVVSGGLSGHDVNFYEDVKSADRTADKEIVRSILPLEDWYVDYDSQCVVPKHSGVSCYQRPQSGTLLRPINYYASSSNSDSFELGGQTFQMNRSCGLSADGSPTCPHYVSICYK